MDAIYIHVEIVEIEKKHMTVDDWYVLIISHTLSNFEVRTRD